MSALNSSMVSAATTVGAKLFQWENRILQGITISLGPLILELCDALVDLVL